MVALCGVVINGFTALLFHSGKDFDLNIKGAYLHLLGDALISFAVVISSIVIYFTGFYILDPILAILVCVFMAVISWGLLKESVMNLIRFNLRPRVSSVGVSKSDSEK